MLCSLRGRKVFLPIEKRVGWGVCEGRKRGEDSQPKLGSYQTWVRTRHGWRHSGKHDRQPMPVNNMVLGAGFFF